MLPEYWGKYGWGFFHMVAKDYPENPTDEDKEHYRDYYTSIQYVLPCSKCRLNYKNHLKKLPITDEVLSNRQNLIHWTIDVHNIVNHYTGKPMLTYSEGMEEIDKLSNPEKNIFSNGASYLLLIILLVILGFIIYYYVKNK